MTSKLDLWDRTTCTSFQLDLPLPTIGGGFVLSDSVTLMIERILPSGVVVVSSNVAYTELNTVLIELSKASQNIATVDSFIRQHKAIMRGRTSSHDELGRH